MQAGVIAAIEEVSAGKCYACAMKFHGTAVDAGNPCGIFQVGIVHEGPVVAVAARIGSDCAGTFIEHPMAYQIGVYATRQAQHKNRKNQTNQFFTHNNPPYKKLR